MGRQAVASGSQGWCRERACEAACNLWGRAHGAHVEGVAHAARRLGGQGAAVPEAVTTGQWLAGVDLEALRGHRSPGGRDPRLSPAGPPVLRPPPPPSWSPVPAPFPR